MVMAMLGRAEPYFDSRVLPDVQSLLEENTTSELVEPRVRVQAAVALWRLGEDVQKERAKESLKQYLASTDRDLRVQGALYGLTRSEVDQRIDELSTLIEFDAIDRWVRTYSGGMKRRLDLAASLMHNPDLLFLDEPTTGLDPTSRARVWEEVRALNSHFGTTIFLTTQYLEEADELADRVGIINAGKIAGEGTPDELKSSVGSDVVQIRLMSDPAPAIAALSDIDFVDHVDQGPRGLLVSVRNGAAAVSPIAITLDSIGADVGGLTLRTPTLDDVFLELTGDRIEVSA